MVKASLVPGKFLSFLFGLLLGIIVALGGLVGGGFYAYKKVKVNSLLKLIGQTDWLSDEFAQYTIEGVVKELQSALSGEITLQRLEEISPALGEKVDGILDNVNQNGFVMLDKETLRTTPISGLSSSIMDVVIITATLTSLGEQMNFSLPEMPLLKGGESGKEVWLYTAANDNEDKTLDKAIAMGEHTYYTKAIDHVRVTEEKKTPLYSLANVTQDEDGNLKQNGKFIYVRTAASGEGGETFRYRKLKADSRLVDGNEGGTYYFLTDSLFHKDALGTAENDGYAPFIPAPAGERTVFEIPSKYSYVELYAKSGNDYVLATEQDGEGKPVAGSGGFTVAERYKNEHLFAQTDVYTEYANELTDEFLQENEVYVRTNGIGDLPVNYAITALSGTLDVNTLTLNKVGEYFGISLETDILAEVMDVPLAYMASSMDDTIQNIQLATVLQLDGSASPVLLYLAYGEKGIDYTIDPATNEIVSVNPPKNITQVMNSIESLAIGNIIDTEKEGTHSLIKAIADWTLDDFGKEEKINSLTLSDVLTIDENSPQILKALQDVSLGSFSDAISNLSLEDMLGSIDEDNTILYVLKDCTIDTLADTIATIAIQDLFSSDIYQYVRVDESEFDNYPELFVMKNGAYEPYDREAHDPDKVYARYPMAYDGRTLSAGYENVPLYAYANGEYVTATRVAGWALPEGAAETQYYYADGNGGYEHATAQGGEYSHSVLYYLDDEEEVASIDLIPCRLEIQQEYTSAKLYARQLLAERSATGGYAYANVYYFDMQTQSFKRVETTYNEATKEFNVPDEYASVQLFTHGAPKGVWKYLLTDESGNEQLCTVNGIGALVNNVSANINKATLNSLHEDGLIQIQTGEGQTPEGLLSTVIPARFTPYDEDIAMGDLSISDTINVIFQIVSVISSFPGM